RAMLNESGKRAVQLAVSRYGADRDRVQSLLHSVVKAQGRGEAVDLLEVFLRAGVLTEAQAQELRSGLQKTRIDPFSPKNCFNGPEPHLNFRLGVQETHMPEKCALMSAANAEPAKENAPEASQEPAAEGPEKSADPTKLAAPSSAAPSSAAPPPAQADELAQ